MAHIAAHPASPSGLQDPLKPDGAGVAATPAVRLGRVSLRLGRANVLHDVSFSIACGEIGGLLAPSGGAVCVLGKPPAQFLLGERRRLDCCLLSAAIGRSKRPCHRS